MLLYVLWLWLSLCFLFFFKQKTAYEMRISDWSSDVCSSDLMARDEIGHFASALTDQCDNRDVGGGAAGDHVDQHRFAHPRTGQNADPLADSQRDRKSVV